MALSATPLAGDFGGEYSRRQCEALDDCEMVFGDVDFELNSGSYHPLSYTEFESNIQQRMSRAVAKRRRWQRRHSDTTTPLGGGGAEITIAERASVSLQLNAIVATAQMIGLAGATLGSVRRAVMSATGRPKRENEPENLDIGHRDERAI